MTRPLHIGIVGCSAEGASLCYRTICTEAEALLGPYEHPEITVHTPPLARYTEALARGDLDRVAELMLASADILAAAGADLLICPDNTIHAAWDRVAPRAPRPWLHIADVVCAAAWAAGHRIVVILGTRWLTESAFYPDACVRVGLDWRRPEEADIEAVDRLIMDELVKGAVPTDGADRLDTVMRRLKGQGADAAALVCTELPLIARRGMALPTLDSTRMLARAALSRAVQDGS